MLTAAAADLAGAADHLRPARRRPTCGRAAGTSGMDGIRLEVVTPQGPHRDRVAPGGRAQRDESPGRRRRRTGARHGAATDRRDAAPGWRRCPAGSSGWRRASPSWWWWTTRTRPTRWSACSPPRASWCARAGASAWSSAAAATATGASAPSWARSRRGSATRVWVTSDNPRTERPEAILAEIETGIPAEAAGRHESMADRRRGHPGRGGLGARGRRGGDRGEGARDLPDHRHRSRSPSTTARWRGRALRARGGAGGQAWRR